MELKSTQEFKRLQQHRARKANWKNWGPYLSERAWGTVREDYSSHGSAWEFLPHEKSRSTAYRWNEDGLAGISDRNQFLCFALALWNGKDRILKERLFGLTGNQGNHGEDVKEYYFYLDSTPTHSYMKMLYKYPHAAFPYEDLVEENAQRGPSDFEYELLDSGAFRENRYFDVQIEYAKGGEEDILVQIEVTNHGPEEAPIDLLPTLWFRNTWSWGYENGPMGDSPGKPLIKSEPGTKKHQAVSAKHEKLGKYFLYAEGAQEFLLTENETGLKDAFHQQIVDGAPAAGNSQGTKACAVFKASLKSGETREFRLRLVKGKQSAPFGDFLKTLSSRRKEADKFYSTIQGKQLSDDEKRVQRQAFAGMLWSKQLYYYDVKQWLEGDEITPPRERLTGRNHRWKHMANFDIISMPDKWEYPWYATWDLAFHCIPLAMVDADFAKRQLRVMTREWYMHPNGQLPAYEWNFDDVNPPVHAWAVWRLYKIDARLQGVADRDFLEEMFHKLMLNFTWWVNRKDDEGKNIFQGGFLGLDNISVFDRSAKLPGGARLDQSDGTAWMGAFSLTLLKIALELSKENHVYEESASKLFEHFLRIANAVNESGSSLWDDEDGFYYDKLHFPSGESVPLKVRSLVGLLSLGVVETLDEEDLKQFPVFARRMDWFLSNRPELSGQMACVRKTGSEKRRLLAFVTPDKLRSSLRYMLDESEFFSDYGIRSVSRYHKAQPYSINVGGETHSINYQPGESTSAMFGGNSNWRGPIWFPINYLLIEALQRFHHYYGDDFKVECPTGSGIEMNLNEVAAEISKRLSRIFLRDSNGKRPVYGGLETFQNDPAWNDLVLFHEYFHGDNGAGLGASHQTGWTGLVAKLLQQSGGGKPTPPEQKSRQKLARLQQFWLKQDGTCPACIQQDLLKVLLEKGEGHFHKQIQNKWPLNAEDSFGVIPTPLRLHADPRYTGKGVTIAMIDSGFYPHPDLTRPVNRIKAWVNATKPELNEIHFGPEDEPSWPNYDDGASSRWHGMMTSVVAAGNGYLSHGLYRGLASDAEIVLIKVSEPKKGIPDSNILRALGWVKDNAQRLNIRVVNMSVSGDPVKGLGPNPIDNAVDELVTAGITVTVASGNDGVRSLTPPATSPSALTVGGIDDQNTFDHDALKLWHSNYGEGRGQVSKPELVAPSLWVVAPVLPGSGVAKEAAEVFANPKKHAERLRELKLVTPDYQHADGTSFAAPLTASAVACLLQATPEMKPHNVREMLLKTAKVVEGASEERQGAGVIQPALAISYSQRHEHAELMEHPELPHLEGRSATFLFHDHDAGKVELSGSWIQWRSSISMKKSGHGVWQVRLPELPPGTHQYKFILNGSRWLDDPGNPMKEPDGNGGYNSLFTIQ